MKTTLPIFIALAIIFASCNTSPNYEAPTSSDIAGDHDMHDHEQQSDIELAHKLGADEYGMRKYVMAFLKAGPNRDHNQEEAQALQKAHLENIGKMADAGKLVLAGPFMDDGELRGIYVFDVETVEEAIELTSTDPMIKKGRLIMEMHPWYGSAALMQVNEIHNKIQSVNISTH